MGGGSIGSGSLGGRLANPPPRPTTYFDTFRLTWVATTYSVPCMDYALLLVFVSAIAVGVVSAVVRTWSFHRRLYSLEDRLSTVEGITQREVKIRAANARPRTSTAAEDAIAMALANPKPAGVTVPWWNSPNLIKGQVAK